MLVRDNILKACEEGVELYYPKARHWAVAEVRTRAQTDYTFFKNAGFACLNDSHIVIFGGYTSEATSSDSCFSWHLATGDKPTITVVQTNIRLAIPEGFENCSALVDEQGFYVLQNVED